MFKKVLEENNREKEGTATKERVEAAMEIMMPPGEFVHQVALLLKQMLGKEAFYSSKMDIWEEALNRLYPQEPETDSDDTIVVDLESD